MKKFLNTRIRDMKAITLIALVITIVVLIILAAVAINLSLGNNVIFNRAKIGKEMYQNAEVYDKEEISKSTNHIDSYISGDRETYVIEELWNGTASAVGNRITLSESYKNYKQLLFIYGNATQNKRIAEKEYHKTIIEWAQDNDGTLRFLWHGTEYTELKVISDTILEVYSCNVAGFFKVYGIK